MSEEIDRSEDVGVVRGSRGEGAVTPFLQVHESMSSNSGQGREDRRIKKAHSIVVRYEGDSTRSSKPAISWNLAQQARNSRSEILVKCGRSSEFDHAPVLDRSSDRERLCQF